MMAEQDSTDINIQETPQFFTDIVKSLEKDTSHGVDEHTYT